MGVNKDKQFNLSKRKILIKSLADGKNATEIAQILECHKSTISREILKYRYLDFKSENKQSLCSTCSRNPSCTLKHRCGRMICGLKCAGCKSLEVCDEYIEIKCNRENRFPFICINCKYINSCKRNHYSYNPQRADTEAKDLRRRCREGINMTASEYNEFDKIILNGVKAGQSIYHIKMTNNLPRSLKAIYNYSHRGQISVRPIDLPRAVTLKRRKAKLPSEYEYNENKNVDRSNHLFADWLVFQAKHRIIIYWEMDFLGVPHTSDQMIMTLVIPQFQFVYLIPFDHPKENDVLQMFNQLDELLGDDFEKVFEAIITDRDPRFNSFRDIEIRDDGVVRTRVFFCNPGVSNEKPFVENLNQQLRIIFPKGTDLRDLTPAKCNEISSNLNSRFLNSIDGKRPIDLFVEYFGIEILKKLGLRIIDSDEVKILKFNKY